MQRALALLVALCLLANQTTALAGMQSAGSEGEAAGAAANSIARLGINATTAQANVPGYTPSPPERAYYGQPNLTEVAQEKLAACATQPDDLTCQALLGAVRSAQTPREPILPTDPWVVQARAIAGNPAPTLGGLAAYYAGCTPANGTVPGNCPANTFCLGDTCFSTAYPKDTDFARAMTFMEAAREAGVYINPDTQEIFEGEASHCRDRLLKNCCSADSAGAGMSNQSMFGTGSRLVFDILMNAQNRRFVYQGISALLTGAGFSGAFTTYGVTLAINGAALPTGAVAVFSGQSIVIAINPWALAVMVVIYVVMSMMSCESEEGLLAMKEGAGLCHTVGTYCSSCLRVLGHCVSCIEDTTGKCCFNSVLARIIHEQARRQFGKGWGTAKHPDCSGFTVAQVQQMDFSAMDLRAFYASIVPALPALPTPSAITPSRVPDCYYGREQCP